MAMLPHVLDLLAGPIAFLLPKTTDKAAFLWAGFWLIALEGRAPRADGAVHAQELGPESQFRFSAHS